MAGLAFGKMPIVNKQTECSLRFTKQEVGGTTFSHPKANTRARAH